MSETGEKGDGQEPDRMYLARIVDAEIERRRRDRTKTYPSDSSSRSDSIGNAKWLSLNAGISKQTAANVIDEPRIGFLAADTIRSITALFEWPDHQLVEANMISLGMKPAGSSASSEWARAIWPWVDQLPEGAKAAARDTLYWHGRLAGLTE